jgi:sec-independent protein translocase protein TatA
MALTDPLQWVVIAIVAIVFLMYGPKKIPELARSIGLARKEFNDAAKTPLSSDVASSTSVAAAPAVAAPSTGDALLDTARKLGISTEGKTRDEISSEIVSRASSTTSS